MRLSQKFGAEIYDTVVLVKRRHIRTRSSSPARLQESITGNPPTPGEVDRDALYGLPVERARIYR